MRIQSQQEAFAYRLAEVRHTLPPDEPHEDWRPLHGDPSFAKWHPPYGESHIKYHVYPRRRQNGKPISWGATCHGLYQGLSDFKSNPLDEDEEVRMPQYSNDLDVVPIPGARGKDFPSMGKAKAAVEKYHAENYGQPQKGIGDYDINELMREQGL